MDIKLNEDERIDDLEFKNLKIIQNKNGFCFGIDAVLLSDFAKNIKNNAKVLDLGTGTGIISILLCGKTNLREIIGVEVQKEVYEMAKKIIKLNNLENKFKIINENILNLEKIYEKNSFDAIVTNPPYKKENTGITNIDEKKLILEGIIDSVSEEKKEKIYHIFNEGFSKLDNEMIRTIEVFFRCGLNLSDAAKELYIHRNTLIYRLDKIEKYTAYDIRNFNNAVLFKVVFFIWKEKNK